MTDNAQVLAGTEIMGEQKVVINMGVQVFEESLRNQGVEVVVVRWSPAPELPEDVADLLDALL
jgi:hypothetical protein